MASLASAEERMRAAPCSLVIGTNKTSVALQIAASLLWVPQAALISIVIGDIAGARVPNQLGDRVGWFAIGVLGIGILKACLEGIGSRIAFRTAREAVSTSRQRVVAALAIRSPLDASRPASGRAASVIAEQAEVLVPYLARFEIAKMKATLA